MPEIDVERKEPRIDYHLEHIIEEMLKEGMRQFSDTRDYKVTIKEDDEEEDKEYTETVTAKIEIQLVKASETLFEKAKKEE
jgi:RNA-binding protein YhbY